jgi:hypothetical protein
MAMADAFVRTRKWISTHDAAETAQKTPADDAGRRRR